MHLCGATLLPLRVILLQYHPKSGERQGKETGRGKRRKRERCVGKEQASLTGYSQGSKEKK